MSTEKLDTEVRGHHPDSPSSLQSSEACPHFENEQRSDTRASDAGTLQHKAAETRNLDILDHEDQVNAVKRCLAMEDRITGELLAITGMPADVVREQYLSVSPSEVRWVAVDGAGRAAHDFGFAEPSVHEYEVWRNKGCRIEKWEGITGGYPDVLLLSSNLAILLDWKFGQIFVTPTKDNLQGIAYALGVFEKYPHVDEVRVIFHHPYLEVEAPLPEYDHVFSRSNIPELELRVRTVIARKHEAKNTGFNGPIPASPRTNLCLWCAKKGTCPALASLAVKVSEKYAGVTLPDAVKVAELKKPEDYAAAFRAANLLENWAKDVKRRCVDAAMTEDMVIPGYELVRRQERTIHDVGIVRDHAIRAGLTLHEFESCVTLPITKVEAKISEKIKALGGKAAPKVREFQEGLVESGAVTMSDGYVYLKEQKTKVLSD